MSQHPLHNVMSFIFTYDRIEFCKTLIGDNEVHNLRATMNEIFGEENFKAHIHWQRKYSVSNNYQGIASITDHILAYSKSERFQNNLLERTEESISRYSNPDNDPRGPWKAVDYLNQASPAQRPNLCYDIINPNTKEVIKNTKKAWKYSREEHQRHVAENRIWWGKNGTNTVPALKLFLSEVRQGMTPHDWWSYEEVGHTDEAKKETEALLGPNVFDTPKPVRLIRRMLELATNPETDDIILDFFAGSGTTAQAVMQQNKDDGGNRKFILVQLPESIESEEFPTIVDITKKRVKKAIVELNTPNGYHTGFKFFRLSSSNFKIWQTDTTLTPDELTRQLRLFADNLHPGRHQKDILYEIVLKSGLPLTASITHLQIGEQSVYSISDGVLLICLEDRISETTLRDIVGMSPRNVVCLDAAFHGNDNLKTNSKLLMESHDIEFHTV